MKQKFIAIVTAVILIASIPLTSCNNNDKKTEKSVVNVRSEYEGKTLDGKFTMRVNITDLPKSLFTNALFDGVFTITYESGMYACVLNSLYVRIIASDTTAEYDSANTYGDEAVIVRNTPYRSFIGVNFKATVDSTGKVTSLTGFDQVDGNIKKELSQYGRNATDQAIFAAKEYMDESVLKLILGLFIGYIPEKGVSPNQNWTYQYKYNAPYILSADISCTLTGTKEEKQVISSAGSLKTAVDEKNYSGLEYALTGTSESKIYLNSDDNMLRNGTYTENVTGYCYYDVNGKSTRDTLSVTRKITFSLEEAKAD